LGFQPLRPVEKWNRSMMRRIESLRDAVMDKIGTKEKLVEEWGQVTIQWRKPLSLDEINQMAPTSEVRERKGRP
jgi:hypothetical protein